MRKGIAGAVGSVAVIAVAFGVGFGLTLGPPGADLLRALAQLGVGLLVAYSVFLARVESRLGRKGTRAHHEDWLGFVTGCGVCAFLGIAAALAASAHRESEQAGALVDVALWWAVASIGMLGIVVAILPIMSYEWRSNS